MDCVAYRLVLVSVILLLAIGSNAALAKQNLGSPASDDLPDYSAAIARVREAARSEVDDRIPAAISVALVDGQQTVMAEGFGWADVAREVPADERTVYRVGSISKLFTAISAMQLVEQGKLALDAPIEKGLPSFRIRVPFDDAPPITLRLLMCHRSGMVRESPRGSYFDFTQPSPAETVASLASCALVNPPNTKTRYSNLGPTIVGQAVAHAAGRPFADYQRQHVLRPLGMNDSAWRADDRLRPRLATGYMRVADDHGGFSRREAPRFELGTIPAGNLYSNATDMARFAKMLLARGQSDGKTIVESTTLEKMWTKQHPDGGFGLGFAIGNFAGQKNVQHSGAVYGFTCTFVVVPDVGIATIVLSNEDIAKGPVTRVTSAALSAMLEAKLGHKPDKRPTEVTLTAEQLARLAGDYESPSYWAELRVVDGRLAANISSQPLSLTAVGPLEFEATNDYLNRAPLKFVERDGQITGFTALDQTFTRVDPARRQPIPDQWKAYLGSYGPDFIPLVVSQRHGRLYAMTENMMDYRLTPVNRCVFKMPPGLYDDELLVFHVDANGRAHLAELANMPLPRRKPDSHQSKAAE